jgi:Metal-dependent hydrolases of the beta-lactamase superfamily III
MRLTFLGTGSALPTGERFQTGLLVESGTDQLLVDCGSGALHGLASTNVGYEGVETVVLTHHHLDHIADLLPLMKARWLAGDASLRVVGPPGTRALLADLLEAHTYMQDRLDLTVSDRPLRPDSFETAGFSLRQTPTEHSMDGLAYRLTPAGPETADPADAEGTPSNDAPTIAYSSDSEASPGLIEFADGAAVLVHDCSFPDDVDVSGHPTPTDLGRALAAADAALGRVYLTHLYPHTTGRHEEMLQSIGDQYDGDVRIARDGLTIDVSRSP